MADDQHPADALIDSIRGIFNGDNIKQSIRDAWDRHFGSQQATANQAPAQTQQPVYQPNAEQQQQINQERGLTPNQAAAIRAKVNK